MVRQSFWTDFMGASFTQGSLDADGARTRYWSAGSRNKPRLPLLQRIHIDFLLGR